jgi:hypothetical protein
MLYASLVISLILLLIVNWIVSRSEHPVPGIVFCCLGFALGPGCLMVIFPAVMWQAGLLSVSLLILLVPRRGKRLYRPLSCVATLIAYSILIHDILKTQHEFAELRQQLPYESLEGRLPTRPLREGPLLCDPMRLEDLESKIERESWYSSRADSLQRLHEHSVDQFVSSAGFGVGRMGFETSRIDAESLKSAAVETPPVPQPDYFDPSVDLTGAGDRDISQRDGPKIGRLHELAVIDFVNPLGFGFTKDRQHVAGFQSHRMTKLPDPSDPWKVARIDLISLLLHESPVAYVSTDLPRMNELRTAPTRPLDAFEEEGLKSLRVGEDLFARGTGEKARMVGAIRATKQCLGCHGGGRGDLLGAFSYGLRGQGR